MNQPPDSDIDWELCTFEGLRRRQHLEFLALPFRRKLELIEGLAEVAERFAAMRAAARD